MCGLGQKEIMEVKGFIWYLAHRAQEMVAKEIITNSD